MRLRYFTLLFLLLSLFLSACGGTESDPSDRETFLEGTYLEVADAAMTYRGGLDRADYSSETHIGEWLTGCGSSDRDEHFDAYILRHEAAEGDKTTFTYLLYYPHGEEGMTAAPELLEGDSGYVINLTYTAGNSTEGYSLSYLSVTLPASEAPRLRLIREGEPLGQMVSVTGEEIY